MNIIYSAIIDERSPRVLRGTDLVTFIAKAIDEIDLAVGLDLARRFYRGEALIQLENLARIRREYLQTEINK